MTSSRTKVRLEMMLIESCDPFVAQASPTLATGRKWTPSEASQQAKAALNHRDIVEQVQQGRGGLGLGQHTSLEQGYSISLRYAELAADAQQRDEKKGLHLGPQVSGWHLGMSLGCWESLPNPLEVSWASETPRTEGTCLITQKMPSLT